jgi:hypothetical protein
LFVLRYWSSQSFHLSRLPNLAVLEAVSGLANPSLINLLCLKSLMLRIVAVGLR